MYFFVCRFEKPGGSFLFRSLRIFAFQNCEIFDAQLDRAVGDETKGARSRISTDIGRKLDDFVILIQTD